MTTVISGIKNLFVETNNYYIRNNDCYDVISRIYLKYNNKILRLTYDGESFSCSLIHGKIDDKNPIIINYEDLKNKYQESIGEENTVDKAIKLVLGNTSDFYEKIYYLIIYQLFEYNKYD